MCIALDLLLPAGLTLDALKRRHMIGTQKLEDNRSRDVWIHAISNDAEIGDCAA